MIAAAPIAPKRACLPKLGARPLAAPTGSDALIARMAGHQTV